MKPGQTWRTAIVTSLAAFSSLATAADICSKLNQQGITIENRLTIPFLNVLQDYWSTACGDLRPTCIASPKSALEMSQIVKELHDIDTLFAVKSGGHMPNNGFASIQDGLLIATQSLNNVIYNAEDQTAIIGPGLSWEDAQKGLDGTGRTLVGGRLGGVGVWGGNYVFSADKTPQVLEAIRDFTENYPDDKAAIIVTAEHAALINTWIMFLFYDGPEPPQGVFDGFKAIGPLDTTKTWDSYYDLSQLKNNDFFILKGQRYTIATETTPVPNKTVGAEVMQTYYDHWFNITNTVLGVPNMIGSIAFQPMPRTIAQKAQARGGDLINFPTDQDYLVIELDFSYGLSASDEKIDAANKNLFNGFDRIISNYIDEGVLPDVYRPLFMNDANYAQDYWARLGSTAQAREVRKKYDPELFFQKRTSGGFRLG
ncbi:hypothetical protein BDV33DRAFT_229632 [Aspergillus novoparasiticus]|uniref:FAD-binding PCMH-type domain-containing protein n=1 Tax=Aspergillus novoparasiticus TaxID=986946 RepID=A0A5N6EZA9_9EURO|nr:hypothetical protein BDV33DRAFT_229632 [Aspergillus novoparasiticus]